MTYTENTQNMIMEAFQSRTYIDNRVDVQNTPLYDTVTFAAAANITPQSSQFFTSVTGPGSAKTVAQTNLTLNGQMPAPEAFSVFGLRYRWREDVLLADLYNILNGFALEFYLGQKYYQRGPLWYFQVGAGINAVTNVANAAIYNNGVPNRESMHKLAIPVVIEANMQFYGTLQGNSLALTAGGGGGTGYLNQLLLDGLYARGIQ